MSNEQITKRRVELSDSKPVLSTEGEWVVVDVKATDYVLPEELEAYVAQASQVWGSVVVSDEVDAGPGGYHGQTTLLDGTVREATSPRGGNGGTFLATEKGRTGPLGLILGMHVALLHGLAAMALMPIQTATMRNTLANAYAAAATHAALYSTAPGSTAGTELTGGSPAYARKPLTWTGTNPKSVTVTFDVASGSSVVGAGVHDALTAGNYLDGTSVTTQNFASQGTYTLTLSFTQS